MEPPRSRYGYSSRSRGCTSYIYIHIEPTSRHGASFQRTAAFSGFFSFVRGRTHTPERRECLHERQEQRELPPLCSFIFWSITRNRSVVLSNSGDRFSSCRYAPDLLGAALGSRMRGCEKENLWNCTKFTRKFELSIAYKTR